jgi:hypothetical protein
MRMLPIPHLKLGLIPDKVTTTRMKPFILYHKQRIFGSPERYRARKDMSPAHILSRSGFSNHRVNQIVHKQYQEEVLCSIL